MRNEDELVYMDDDADDELTELIPRTESVRASPKPRRHNDDNSAADDLEDQQSGAAQSNGQRKRPALGLLRLTAFTYFAASGGPFGLEVAIAAGGPGHAVLMLLILVVFVSLPSALVTAELSSALPGRGGFINWVDRGLNPTVGTLNSWICLINGAVDASAYPNVCCEYLAFTLRHFAHTSVPVKLSGARRAVFKATIVAMTCGFNLCGISNSTRVSIALAIFSFAPFLVALLLLLRTPAASTTMMVGALFEPIHGAKGVDFYLLACVCFWSCSGYDNVSFVSSDVGPDAPRVIPRALGLAIVATAIGTILPVLIAAAALGPHPTIGYAIWDIGAFEMPAEIVGGKPLGLWTCIGGIFASLGLLTTFLCTAARNVQNMAIKGQLPAALRREVGAEATPAAALVFSSLCVCTLVSFSFDQIIEVNMALYSATLAMENLALLRLRWVEPRLRRPFRIPCNSAVLALMLVPQISFCVAVIAFSMRTLLGVLLWLAVFAVAYVVPRITRMCRGRAPNHASELERDRWRAAASSRHIS